MLLDTLFIVMYTNIHMYVNLWSHWIFGIDFFVLSHLNRWHKHWRTLSSQQWKHHGESSQSQTSPARFHIWFTHTKGARKSLRKWCAFIPIDRHKWLRRLLQCIHNSGGCSISHDNQYRWRWHHSGELYVAECFTGMYLYLHGCSRCGYKIVFKDYHSHINNRSAYTSPHMQLHIAMTFTSMDDIGTATADFHQ